MKKSLQSLLGLAAIALLLLASFIVSILLIGRSNWQARVKLAEAGNLEQQKLLAHYYATGSIFFQSGFLIGHDIEKARHWRGLVCAATKEEEFCRKL